ncbi:hypothetical protein C9I92_09770 [Photobacterium ganghwense]|nr:hypothetical protein C9I92_09770 [Photobacterium ganghwense]
MVIRSDVSRCKLVVFSAISSYAVCSLNVGNRRFDEVIKPSSSGTGRDKKRQCDGQLWQKNGNCPNPRKWPFIT